jgi:hypothetical protein
MQNLGRLWTNNRAAERETSMFLIGKVWYGFAVFGVSSLIF